MVDRRARTAGNKQRPLAQGRGTLGHHAIPPCLAATGSGRRDHLSRPARARPARARGALPVMEEPTRDGYASPRDFTARLRSELRCAPIGRRSQSVAAPPWAARARLLSPSPPLRYSTSVECSKPRPRAQCGVGAGSGERSVRGRALPQTGATYVASVRPGPPGSMAVGFVAGCSLAGLPVRARPRPPAPSGHTPSTPYPAREAVMLSPRA